MPDLFISFSSRDREQIRPIVSALRSAGIDVWWDERVEEGGWSPQIEGALEASRRVLAFVSRNVVSSDTYFVQAEIARAHKARKLLPVKIGEFTMSLHIEGYVLGEQMMIAKDFADFLGGSGFRRVCRLCGRGNTPEPTVEQPIAHDWLEGEPSPSQLALGLAIAVAESAPLPVVTEFAQDLERRLIALIEPNQTAAQNKPFGTFLQSRTKRLEAIGAVRYEEQHRRYDTKVECVRFADPQRSAEVLERAWAEFDSLRKTLITWLDHLAHTAGADARQRLGLMIGFLARAPAQFSSVYDELLLRWLMDDQPATRDLADMALCVAVFDPTLQSTVSQIIREYAQSDNPERLRAAIEIACGYTGARIKGLSVEILKVVAQSRHKTFEVLQTMDSAIAFMVNASLETDDTSLFNLGQLIGDLSDWARAPDRKTPQRLPMYLFLRLMAKLPLRAPPEVAGLLSLDALVFANPQTPATIIPILESTARVFEAAMRDPGDEDFSPRDAAIEILRHWMAVKPEDGETDPLLEFAGVIYSVCLSSRDCDRLVFTMRKRYTREQIVGRSKQSQIALLSRGA